MKAPATIVILTFLVSCGQNLPQRTEVKQSDAATPSAVQSTPSPARVAPSTANAGPHYPCGLEAYPLPRSYKQVLADAPQAVRKPTGSLQANLAIDASGSITHLRFMRLSSLDSVNRAALQAVTSWRFKPTVLDGKAVAVCSVTDINIDF